MTHDEAVKYALSGPPFPSEAVEHMAACAPCRAEREALRALEEQLVAAAVSSQASPRLEARVLERLGHRSPRSGWTRGSVAAALLLSAALLGAWVGRGPVVSNTHDMGGVPPSAESVLWPAPEDSTAALLRAFDPEAGASRQVSAEEIKEYLSPSGQGGWNG